MRRIHLLIGGILLTLSVSVNAQFPPSSTDTTTVNSEDIDLYKLITTGIENDIKQYFNKVTPDELIRSDNRALVRGINKLKSNDKVTHTIWILEEVKNRPPDIREHVYTELEKVEYNKPSFFLKQMINNYFTNYNENEAALVEKVSAIQKKMNR